MRPLRLRVENLTAFRGEQPVLDIGPYELFAIAGPTGSGKTSLLDAMLIALYGEVPRTSNNLKELVSQGRDRMCVRLDFAVGGAEYRVTRVVYANTRPAQAILERLVDGGETTPIADGITAVEAEIERLVGLNYDTFTQAVILPQGKFDQFLRSKPRERNDILKELLRLQVYERMREKAETESKLADATVKMISQMLESTYAGATKEAVAAVVQEINEARKANATLAKRLEELGSLAEALRNRIARVRELVEARATLRDLELRRKAIEADQTRLNASRRAAVIVPQLDAAERASAEAVKASEAASASEAKALKASDEDTKAKSRLAAATQAAARIPDLDTRIEALGRAIALSGPIARARRQLDEAKDRQRKQEAESTKANKAATEAREKARRTLGETKAAEEQAVAAQSALAAAEGSLQAAQVARETGIRTNAIAHLRHGLKPADPCPICERPLDSEPREISGSDESRLAAAVREAEAAVRRSRVEQEASRSRLEEARQTEIRLAADAEAKAKLALVAGESLEQVAVQLDAAMGQLAELDTQLQQLTAERDPLEAQARARQEKERLASELAEAQRLEARANADLAAARAAVEAANARATDASVSALTGQAQADRALREAGFDSPKGAREALFSESEGAAISESIEDWKRQLHSASERTRALEKVLAKEDTGAESLKGLEPQFERAEQDLEKCREERDIGLQDESRLDQRRRDLEERVAQAEQKRKELDEAQARLGPLRQLALDLRSNQFQAYLLEETFRELVEGASARLLKLSGRYGFEFRKDAFFVIDHDNASERRRAETLSGGETFLASLALALELSQQVQRSAGAVDIESLFIDEGFGSLDSDALDVVADAIESLPTAGRMVGIITHLPELTARLPVCIQVEKGPEGSRITLRTS
jgi:exonuclease SbcC